MTNRNCNMWPRRWYCALLLALVALMHAGCSLTLPLSLLTLLVRNDTAPDANAVVLCRPAQYADSQLMPCDEGKPPEAESDDGASS